MVCKITDPSDYIIANGAIKPKPEETEPLPLPKKPSHLDSSSRSYDNSSKLAGKEMPRLIGTSPNDLLTTSNGFIPTIRKPYNLYDQLEMHKDSGHLTSPRAIISPLRTPPADYNDGDEEDRIALEAELHLRKRFLCTQMVDCARLV